MTSEADTDVDALKRGWRTNPPQRLSTLGIASGHGTLKYKIYILYFRIKDD